MIRIIHSCAEFISLREEWGRLAARMRHPLLSYDWMLSAANAFYPPDSLNVIVLFDGERIHAVAPLAKVRIRGQTRLELIGASRLHEPSGLLFDTDDSLSELCAALTTLPYPVLLQRIGRGQDIEARIHTAIQGHGSLVCLGHTASPFLAIQNSWEDYFNTLSGRRRHDFRRARARLEKQGVVTTEFHTPDLHQLGNLLDRAFRVESSGWKGQRGSGLAVNLPLRQFFSAYSKHAGESGQLRICFLCVNDVPIATHLAIVHDNTWWVLKIGFDDCWSDYSPGFQLTMETLRHAFTTRLDAYEFLGTTEPWLRIWTQEEHSYSTLALYPSNMRGYCARSVDGIARVAGKLANRFMQLRQT